MIVQINNVTVDDGTIKNKSTKIKTKSNKSASASIGIYSTITDGLPQVGQDIQILEDTTTKFGGIIKSVSPVPFTPEQGVNADLLCTVSSDGYNSIPARRTIGVNETATTSGAIVTKMVNNYLVDEGVTLGTIITGATIDSYVYTTRGINEVLDDMANASGCEWNINNDKELDFVYSETLTYETETIKEDDGDHFNFRPKECIGSYRNKQFVEGGIDADGANVIVNVEDSTEIAARQTIEGGSGVYGNVFRDTNIQSEADALVVANELLNRNKITLEATVSSYREFTEGNLILVSYSKYGIADDTPYLITQKSMIRDAHEWVYSYKLEHRDITSFSAIAQKDGVDFFTALSNSSSNSSTSGITDNSGQAYYGSYYDIATALSITTTLITRSLDVYLPYLSDAMQNLTISFTATATGTLTLTYKIDTVTKYTFTIDYVIGDNTKTFTLPESAHAVGTMTIDVDLVVSVGTLTINDYILTSRWERAIAIPAPTLVSATASLI